jgi:nitric oxide reductase large subunit
MPNITEHLNEFYNDISGSFFTKTYQFSEKDSRIILYGIYGFFVLLNLLSIGLEACFKKKRKSRCLRWGIVFMWIKFGLISLLFALLLNIVIPVASSMSEFGEMIEPMIFNQSFYSNLEWPSEEFKSAVGSCLNH